MVEGGYVAEAFQLGKVHGGEGAADLPYGERSLVLFLLDFQDEQGDEADEADEEVCSDSFGGADIDGAHVEVGFLNAEAFFDFPAP